MSSEQYLIQSLMWRQCVSEDYFKRLATKCLKVDSKQSERVDELSVNTETVGQLLSRVNRNIRAFHMQVSRGPNESDGTVFYALINTADNELTRLSNQLSNKEILYFRKLIANIIESDNSLISSTKALNIGREEDSKFTNITVAEHLINKWVEQKWFEEVGDGSLAVGVRTLLEMNVYIREHFEVQDCFRCKTLCIRGSNCMSCDTKLHFHCVDSQFIPNNKCPNCGKQWTPNEEVFAINSSRNSEQVLESNNGLVVDREVEADNGSHEESADEEEVKPIRKDKRRKRY